MTGASDLLLQTALYVEKWEERQLVHSGLAELDVLSEGGGLTPRARLDNIQERHQLLLVVKKECWEKISYCQMKRKIL